MQGDIEMRIAVLNRRKMTSNQDLDSKLLLQFPAQSLLPGFPLLHLASGKLPMPLHIAAPGPPADEVGPIPGNSTGYHLDMVAHGSRTLGFLFSVHWPGSALELNAGNGATRLLALASPFHLH